VEYLSEAGAAITGWILTLDVGIEPPPTATYAP
jgi:hypothetical protein